MGSGLRAAGNEPAVTGSKDAHTNMVKTTELLIKDGYMNFTSIKNKKSGLGR